MFARLFQWDEFLTPTLVHVFFILAVILVCLGGLMGVFNAFRLMTFSFFSGVGALLFTLVGVIIGVILARMSAEMILVAFKIHESLDDIRNRGGSM